jgi:glycosyltransferase involved in cell wall biosynthesis
MGMEQATGQYIVFLDSDDYLSENVIADLLQKRKKDNELISFKVNILKEKRLYPQEYDGGVFNIDSHTAQRCALGCENQYDTWFLNTVWGKLYNLDMIKKNGIRFNVNLSRMEDILFNLCYLECTKSVDYISVDGYNYRISDTSLVRAFDAEYASKLMKALEALHKFESNNPVIKNCIYYKSIMMTNDYISNKLFANKNISLQSKRMDFLKICQCDQVIESASNLKVEGNEYKKINKYAYLIRKRFFWPYLILFYLKMKVH